MSIETLTDFFFWCSAINIGLLSWWGLIIIFARDKVYQYHRKWFKLSENQFDNIHYIGIAVFKISIFMFNIVPYLALKII